MNESNSIETLTNIHSHVNAIPLSDQTKFRPERINKIKDYFNYEIQERKTMSKKLSKYIDTFDYFDKTLVTLSATSRGISIISFTSIIGAPVRIASASFSLIFSLTTGIIKKLLKITRDLKKKHNNTFMLAKNKSQSIETLISQALIDLEITHEEFKTILNERDKYEEMQENIRNIKSNDRKDELSENNSYNRKNNKNTQIFLKHNFLCIYKMVNISVKNYQNARVYIIITPNRELFWVKMIDVQRGLGIKNKSYTVKKEIHGIFENKNPTEKQIRKYKRSEKEFDEKSKSSF